MKSAFWAHSVPLGPSPLSAPSFSDNDFRMKTLSSELKTPEFNLPPARGGREEDGMKNKKEDKTLKHVTFLQPRKGQYSWALTPPAQTKDGTTISRAWGLKQTSSSEGKAISQPISKNNHYIYSFSAQTNCTLQLHIVTGRS